jgi:hypothetical protein
MVVIKVCELEPHPIQLPYYYYQFMTVKGKKVKQQRFYYSLRTNERKRESHSFFLPFFTPHTNTVFIHLRERES